MKIWYRDRQGSRGFTLIAVIFMFIVIAAAVAAMTVLFATENRRTIGTHSGTQLRQLLLASAPAAEEELKLHGSAAREWTLPTPLPEAKVTLTFKPVSEGKADVRIDVKMGRSSASQTLRYIHSGQSWALESATLHADGSRISTSNP
ncbi:MAG: hypothetical protein FWD61_00850 [Phycisphaerales bacterium]|nr:hypothetical protein [Phycisphaerales bacterium]